MNQPYPAGTKLVGQFHGRTWLLTVSGYRVLPDGTFNCLTASGCTVHPTRDGTRPDTGGHYDRVDEPDPKACLYIAGECGYVVGVPIGTR